MWVRSLAWEDPLEKGMATYFSILARKKIPWTEEPGGLWGRNESDTTERLSLQELNKKLPILSSHAEQTVPFTT